jgi:hypothetical protein
MKTTFLITLFLASAQQVCMAGALINLNGKLVSFTETEVVIQTKKTVYHFKKMELSPEQIDHLPRVGSTISVWIPTDSITWAKPIAEKSAQQGER